MTKTARFLALYVLYSFLVIEGALWGFLYFRRYQFEFAEPSTFSLSAGQIQALGGIFDPALGWKENNGTKLGERPDGLEKTPVAAVSFGDSFTFGSEVDAPDTWQSLFARKSSGRILNFGVEGYGLDQALLFFESKASQLPGRYAILGFVISDIYRSMNIYRHFLRGDEGGAPLTKPRFELENGHLNLIPNPVRSRPEMAKLADPRFIESLEPLDAYRTELKGVYPPYSFPRTRLLFNREFYRQLRGHYPQIRSSEGEELAQALLFRFKESARRAGKTPVIVLFPDVPLISSPDLARVIGTQFELFCKNSGLTCYSPWKKFLEMRQNSTLFEKGGHYSSVGNALIAEGLKSLLVQ